MELIRDIDWSAYLDTEDRARVRPASEYAQDVIDTIHNPQGYAGNSLPWPKTEGRIALRRGELSIWAGVNGHGKSLLTGQVCLGLMQQSERVCIASLEMRPRLTMLRMVRHAAGEAEPRIPHIRAFHEWTDGKLWLYDQQGTVKSERMVALARYCAQELDISHMVIDSLMKCGLGTDDYNGQKHLADELSTLARDTGMHIHVVAHSRKKLTEHQTMDKFDIKGASEITDMADNVFTVWRNKAQEAKREEGKPTDGQPDCLLTCDKQRNGDWEGKVGLYWHQPSGLYSEHDGPVRGMWSVDDPETVRAQ